MTIVVTGATGNVGRPLVAELVAAGARVRAISRAPKTAGFPPRVEVVGSAADALTGASAVFLNSRALGEQLPKVVDQCLRAGVTKLVALSAINADDDFSRQPSRKPWAAGSPMPGRTRRRAARPPCCGRPESGTAAGRRRRRR